MLFYEFGMIPYEQKKEVGMQSIIRFDLALLAAKVAMDIDTMLSGKAFIFSRAKRLSKLLEDLDWNSIEYNSSATAVLNTATKSLGKPHDFKELRDEVSKIAGILSGDKLMENHNELDRVRSFCLELTEEIMSRLRSCRNL